MSSFFKVKLHSRPLKMFNTALPSNFKNYNPLEMNYYTLVHFDVQLNFSLLYSMLWSGLNDFDIKLLVTEDTSILVYI